MKKNKYQLEAKIDLEQIIDNAICELKEIRESSKEQRYKTQSEKRLAVKIKNAMRNDARKRDSKKVKLSTFSRYLTKVRKAVAGTIYKHHTINKKLDAIAKKAPCYAEQLESIKGMSCADAKEKIAELCKALRADSDVKTAQELAKIDVMPELLRALQLSDDERQELDSAKERTIVSKQARLIKLDAEKIQALIARLLASESVHELALGVALATGRRQIEILIQGEFKAAKKGLIAFTGQAKERKQSNEANLITPLADAKLIISAIETIRASEEVSQLQHAMSCASSIYNANEAFNNSSRDFTSAASNILGTALGQKAGSVSTAFNASGWTFKDSRPIFARMSYAIYEADCMRRGLDLMDDALYFTQTLGHADAHAQRSYRAFKIVGNVRSVSFSEVEQAKEQIIEQANAAQAARLEALKKLSRTKAAKPFADIFEKLLSVVAAEPAAKITTQFMRTTVKGRNERLSEVMVLIKAANLTKLDK